MDYQRSTGRPHRPPHGGHSRAFPGRSLVRRPANTAALTSQSRRSASYPRLHHRRYDNVSPMRSSQSTLLASQADNSLGYGAQNTLTPPQPYSKDGETRKASVTSNQQDSSHHQHHQSQKPRVTQTTARNLSQKPAGSQNLLRRPHSPYQQTRNNRNLSTHTTKHPVSRPTLSSQSVHSRLKHNISPHHSRPTSPYQCSVSDSPNHNRPQSPNISIPQLTNPLNFTQQQYHTDRTNQPGFRPVSPKRNIKSHAYAILDCKPQISSCTGCKTRVHNVPTKRTHVSRSPNTVNHSRQVGTAEHHTYHHQTGHSRSHDGHTNLYSHIGNHHRVFKPIELSDTTKIGYVQAGSQYEAPECDYMNGYKTRDASSHSEVSPDSIDSGERISRSQIKKMATSCHRLPSIDQDEQVDLSTKTDKELKAMIKDLRNRYRSTMMHNAHLDNEKQALQYQLENVQDQLDEETVNKQQAAQQLRDWNRSVEDQKRTQIKLDFEIDRLKNMMIDRDQLIKDHDLVMVPVELPTKCEEDSTVIDDNNDKADLGDQAKNIVKSCMQKESSKTFDDTIRELVEENDRIKTEISDARQNLSELREKNSYKSRHHLKSSYTDTAGRMSEIKRLEHEQNMILADYQQQVNNANIKIDTLESQLMRLEGQMHRYREMYEESEQTQQDIKSENRKLSRKIEESRRESDELERECKHLEIRIDKVKSARSNAYNGVNNPAS